MNDESTSLPLPPTGWRILKQSRLMPDRWYAQHRDGRVVHVDSENVYISGTPQTFPQCEFSVPIAVLDALRAKENES